MKRRKKDREPQVESSPGTEPAPPGTPRETRARPGGRKASLHPRQDVNAEDQTGEGLKPGTELRLKESGLMNDLEAGRRRIREAARNVEGEGESREVAPDGAIEEDDER